MERRLVSALFPYIPVTIAVGKLTRTVDALLDTGFDGDFIVPRRLREAIGVPNRYDEFILVTGSSVHRPVFLGTIDIGPFGSFPIEIAALGGDFLLGRGLAERFRITLDHGRRIILEP